jgi:hypothetical protein
MTLTELAGKIGAALLTPAAGQGVVRHVYAGDRISDLLTHAHDGALLVSNLSGPQLIRLAELMDGVALCLVGGQMPDDAVIAAAAQHGTGVLVSPAGVYETCGLLYACLQDGRSQA